MKARNLTNLRFGRLIVLGPGSSTSGKPWLCRCDCGVEKELDHYNLIYGRSSSCGCYRIEKSRISIRQIAPPPKGIQHYRYKDGRGKHPLNQSWRDMLSRCNDNPENPDYKHYAGRGISVCDRWRFGEEGKTGFECFVEDMGSRPKGLTLDRRNNNGNYEPSNCRWATYSEQNNNRRPFNQPPRLNMRGRRFITDNKIERLLRLEEEVPEGWRLGRLRKIDKHEIR